MKMIVAFVRPLLAERIVRVIERAGLYHLSLSRLHESGLGACTQQEIVNAYDNAILATDDFLARTIDMPAQDTSHNTALIYVSGHGESLGERNLHLHGIPYAFAPDTQIRVPMVTWLSPGMAADRGLGSAQSSG